MGLELCLLSDGKGYRSGGVYGRNVFLGRNPECMNAEPCLGPSLAKAKLSLS